MPIQLSPPPTHAEHLARVTAPRKCEYCEQDFTPKKSWQKYCSAKCRHAQNGWLRTAALQARQEEERENGR